MAASFVRSVPTGLELDLVIQPKASKNELVGVHDGRLKVRITAPPVDGKANDALRKFLSKIFGISKSNVILISGASSRRKRVRLVSDAVASLQDKLDKFAG